MNTDSKIVRIAEEEFYKLTLPERLQRADMEDEYNLLQRNFADGIYHEEERHTRAVNDLQHGYNENLREFINRLYDVLVLK